MSSFAAPRLHEQQVNGPTTEATEGRLVRFWYALQQPLWKLEGACNNYNNNPDAWFPTVDGMNGELANRAKEICLTECPVRERCLAQALEDREEFGIFGGKTPRERRALLSGRVITPEESREIARRVHTRGKQSLRELGLEMGLSKSTLIRHAKQHREACAR